MCCLGKRNDEPTRSAAVARRSAQSQNPCETKRFVVYALDSSLEPQIYALRYKAAVLCDHGKGRRGGHEQYVLCKCQLTPPPRAGSCEESPTKLKLGDKLGSGGPGPKAPAPPATGPAREAPSSSRRRRRRVACLPCSAAPKSAGCRQPRAKRRRVGREGRQCRAASSHRATIRAQSCPPAQRPGRRAAPPRP